MTPSPAEQRNPYKGSPPRPWVRVRLVALTGAVEELDLVADTGSPFPLIIGLAGLYRLRQQPAPDVYANCGNANWFWIRPAGAGL